VLYRVNDSPVVLLYGSTPAYRTLSAGATGPDVAELNADLVALGYATSAQLSPTSASFGSATTTAVEKLQAALGVTQNGTLTLGQAVFEPTAVRVTTVSAQLGGSARPARRCCRPPRPLARCRWRWTPRNRPTWRSGTR
jgi:multidrug efflux system membrane fusion protein